jgi:Flp pilus assembly protein TadG
MPRPFRLRRSAIGQLVRRGHRVRGQSLAEFALIAPVMLGLLGVGVDFARLFFAWVDLEAATRDAAQYVASDPAFLANGSGYYDVNDSTNYCATYPCTSAPSTDAKTVIDAATGKSFTKASSQIDCSSPKVWAILSSPDTTLANGGSSQYPVAVVHVTACFPFRTFVSYPIITTNGTWIVRADRTLSTIVGR